MDKSQGIYTMKTIIALLVCTGFALSQPVRQSSIKAGGQVASTTVQTYEIPFASSGNVIELSVSNTSIMSAKQVKVELTNAPEWLKFNTKQVTLQTIKAKEEQAATFNFSVDKMAEVNKEQTLNFSIADLSGQKWSKDIKFKVAPPANYELFQNYPNPFNPTSKIEYQLPANCDITLKVYDLLGREVASLVDERQETGYHQSTFDASRLASGTYIYRIIALDDQNNRHVFQKKMIVLK